MESVDVFLQFKLSWKLGFASWTFVFETVGMRSDVIDAIFFSRKLFAA